MDKIPRLRFGLQKRSVSAKTGAVQLRPAIEAIALHRQVNQHRPERHDADKSLSAAADLRWNPDENAVQSMRQSSNPPHLRNIVI